VRLKAVRVLDYRLTAFCAVLFSNVLMIILSVKGDLLSHPRPFKEFSPPLEFRLKSMSDNPDQYL